MKKRKWKAVFFAAVLAGSLLTGCGAKDGSGTDGSGKQPSQDKESYMVQVREVNGNEITAVIGEMAGRQGKQDGQVKEPPDGGQGEAPDGENGQMPERPDGEQGEAANAETGWNGKLGKPFGGFTAGDEEITFKVTDETEITVEVMPDIANPRELRANREDADAGADGTDGKPPVEGNDGNVGADRQETMEFGVKEGTVEDIAENTILEVCLDREGNALSVTVRAAMDKRDGMPDGGFGGSDTVVNGTAAVTISEDAEADGEHYESSGDDENALRVDGSKVTLKGITVDKTGGASSNTENGDFYGQNAGLLALNGADVTIEGAEVNTSAVNGNGIFSYGGGTTVTVSDSLIKTSGNNSGGIQTTGGGTMKANNLIVETQGNSAAAIRSDRGGGTVAVEGGSYTSNGTGSPAVYCTADITVTDAMLTANASEGVVVEGKNSIALRDCLIVSNMENTYHGDADENIHAIMIYQSMSGDADVGEAAFLAEGGTIAAKQGDMFYVTNTDCKIGLKDVKLELANGTLLRAEGNDSSRGWGTQGENGGAVSMTASSQQLEGNIYVDVISSLALTMTDNTVFEGAVNPDGEGGAVMVTLSEDSAWTLSGDSYITGFEGSLDSVNANGHHLFVNGGQVL